MKLNETARIGLGCMNLSHAYGTPPPEQDAVALLNRALDIGYNHFDTAALYGFGANESLIGKAVSHRRDEFFLASKCVLVPDDAGKRSLDGRPETIKKTCDAALKRLSTDYIDLYYLHRYDKNVPLEDSMGAMADLVSAGKIGAVGLSEVSAETLARAHAVHPIAAVQTEFSLWTRNADIAVIDKCRELGTTFVAFSPVARGYLCGTLTDVNSLGERDLRRTMPRFSAENYPKNLELLTPLQEVAEELNATMAQVALAWVLQRDAHIVAIPGTTRLSHLQDNFEATGVTLSDLQWQRLDKAINDQQVYGRRYNDAAQADIDTENF
ncbi:aldo/keto reductase [Reinekea blandensis]|uniref:Predicted oxidoreductase n=1 Tax=Reinekea blandensis MED297 TaxID=314283 RepID=A4BGW7_9GAMM|nr:aldo/keto reductase [Reinekea blandensis]EAR08613.1 Predicted oxidoreductase [Reinekea sp. MED297] [Reinekea blandensis MED297]